MFSKKLITKIICLFCSTIMIFSLTACGGGDNAFALSPEEQAIQRDTLIKPSQNDEYMYDVYTTYIKLRSYMGDGGDIIIPEMIDDKPVYVIGKECFAKCTSITSVTMGDNIWVIEDRAFGECSAITNVVLSQNLKIMNPFIFYKCSSLEEIAIPETVTDIGQSAFASCNSLTTLTIPRRTQFIAGGAFNGCQNLVEIIFLDGTIIDETTGQVTDTIEKQLLSGAFSNCKKLERVYVPKTVVKLENPFNGCNKECMYYGYAPSTISAFCSTNGYFFTEIVEGDEIDLLISAPKPVINTEK